MDSPDTSSLLERLSALVVKRGVTLGNLGDADRTLVLALLTAAGTTFLGTLMALMAGTEMAEHNSPGQATLQVLRGRVRVSTAEDSWEGGPGDLLVIPPERHGLVDNVKRIESRITHFKGSRHVLQADSGCRTGKLNSMSKALCHSTNGASCVA